MKLLAVLTIDTCIVVLEFCRALLKVCSIKRLDKIQRPPSPPWTISLKNGWPSWKCTNISLNKEQLFGITLENSLKISFNRQNQMKINWVVMHLFLKNVSKQSPVQKMQQHYTTFFAMRKIKHNVPKHFNFKKIPNACSLHFFSKT